MKTGKLPLIIFAASALALLMLLAKPGAQNPSAEERIAQALSAISGAGRVQVVLYAPDENAAPTGALVVAEGAGDMAVRLNLIRAVRTLLGLPETAVDVFAMEEGAS